MRPRTSYWLLTLACGHQERRPAVWRLIGRVGVGGVNEALRPPFHARCATCAKVAPAEQPEYLADDGETIVVPPEPIARAPWQLVRRASLRAGNRVLVELRSRERPGRKAKPILTSAPS